MIRRWLIKFALKKACKCRDAALECPCTRGEVYPFCDNTLNCKTFNLHRSLCISRGDEWLHIYDILRGEK